MNKTMSTRDAYGEALVQIGADEKVVALDADVSSCTKSCLFGSKYPDRFYNVGIAEANMVGVAAGMATCGLKPFVHSFAMFSVGRVFDQIRNSVAYPRLNVKIVGTHAGVTVGEDGATHQCLEDIALTRSIPGMVVVVPADDHETHEAVSALAGYEGPAYLRLGRMAVKTVTDIPSYKFELGKAVLMRPGNDLTIIATGIMVAVAMEAAEILAETGIDARVLNIHTIKPIDKVAIIQAAKETGAIITAEEHNVMAGLGSTVAEVVTDAVPAPVLKVGVEDSFGRSGNAEALLQLYGLTKEKIIQKAKSLVDNRQDKSTED